MKKNIIIALLLAFALAIVCTGCSSSTSTPTPTTPNTTEATPPKTEPPVSEVITETTTPPSSATTPEPDNTVVNTPVITPTPDNTPDDTHVNPDIFKNTYWINSSLEIGYFFKEDGTATVYMAEMKSEATYSFSGSTLTIDEAPLPYSLKDDQLTVTFFDGLDIVLDKSTEEQFKELIKDSNITPDPDITADSDYIGLTVTEFVKTGADISGYMGINGEYQFTAFNTEKNEKYTFSLTGGDIKAALDSKTFDNEYEDVLADFTISQITIIKLNTADLQKYVGKTIAEFEGDGFEINGFMYSGDLILWAYDKNNSSIKITLNGNASEVYKGLDDPFDADMGEVFAQFTIKTIDYSSY